MPNAGPTVSGVSLISAFTESSFANDESASLSSYTPIPFQEGSAQMALVQEMHDPMHAVQIHHDYREEILGKKSCTLSFTMPLAPTGTAADASTAAVQSALGLLLSISMGSETLGNGSTASANWSSAKSGNIATAGGFAKGTAIGWVNTASTLECRPVANLSGSTLSTKLAFSAVPQSSDVIYASATYALASDPDSTLNFAVRGLEADDDWLLLGCQLDSVSLSLPLDGTIPTVQFTYKGVSWLHGDDAAGTFSNITPVTYSNTDPITGQAGRFMARTTDTQSYTAGVTINVSAVAFDPQLSYVPITSPSGTQGVLRWRLSRNNGPSVTGSFSTYYEGQKWHDHRLNKDDLLLLYQIGQSAGSSILLEAATVQITDAQVADGSGIQSASVSWKARRDTTVTTASTDLHYSPLRIHFL